MNWRLKVISKYSIHQNLLNIRYNSGYFTSTEFVKYAKQIDKKGEKITFYDSNTGKALFQAPQGRSMKEFLEESKSHGWPSFRDEEVLWDNGVRCLQNGEAVSLDGTHLGHNLPDRSGNRYCINLVCVAGNPTEGKWTDWIDPDLGFIQLRSQLWINRHAS